MPPDHPDRGSSLRPKIEEMKSEIAQYNTLVKAIKPAAQRLDDKGKDTFNLGGSHL